MEESDYVKRVVRLGICIYTQILCFSLLLIPAGLDISKTYICNCWSLSGYFDFGFSSR